MCDYNMSPRGIRLFRYQNDHSELKLQEFGVEKEKAQTLFPYQIDNDSLRLEIRPGAFRNFKLLKPREGSENWLALHGLWQSDGSDTDEFLVFTPWNTVFGRKRDKDGHLLPLWARYQVRKVKLQPSSGVARNIVLWGLHGEESLGNLAESVHIDGTRMVFRKTTYQKRADNKNLPDNPSTTP